MKVTAVQLIAKVLRFYFKSETLKVFDKALFGFASRVDLADFVAVGFVRIIPGLNFSIGKYQVEQSSCEENAEHHPEHESPLVNCALKMNKK